jgi:glycerol-3-phosphate dehydrogenase
MGKEMDIDLPIINAVYAVLYEDKRPSELLANLMVRPLKDESDE